MAERIILSMATIPSRIGTYGPTFASLETQSLKFDKLFIAGVEEISAHLFFDVDTHFAWDFEPHEDRGPVNKLAVLYQPWLTDDDIIVTIDDDIIYQPKWLETLVEGARKHPNKAVGFCGWNAYDFIDARDCQREGGGWYVWPPNPGPCDVLEGWSGIAYRRSFFYFDPLIGPSVMLPPAEFRFVDDVWIAYHLHRRGIARQLIGHPMSKERDGALPGLHHRPDFVDLNRQAALIAFGGSR